MTFLSRDNLTIILYSSILITILEALLFKLSPQIYSVFNTLPILIAGLILKIDLFFFSLIFSNILFLLSSLNNLFFFDNFVFSKITLNLFIISSLVFIFIYLLRLKKINASFTTSRVLVFLTLTAAFFLFFFNLLYYSKFASEDIRNLLLNIIPEITYPSQSTKDYENLVDLIIKILPSINTFVLLLTLIANFFLAKFFVNKLKFKSKYSLNFKNFSTPKWFFFLYLFFIIFSIILENDAKYQIINITIILTLTFFIEGSLIFFDFFKKFKISINVKILIIFLLFIFLGYVLLLTIIFLGLYSNFKNILRK